MNTATNPRTTGRHGRRGQRQPPGRAKPPATATRAVTGVATGTRRAAAGTQPLPDLDRRRRAQKLLDGLVGACAVALTTGRLPANGGLRPQVTATINERDLLTATNPPPHRHPTWPRRSSHGTSYPRSATVPGSRHRHPSTSRSWVRCTANTIRKIACDADILPVLLGSDSRVLDIGRTTRIFPPHIRKAITARDGGCAFPDCTMPAPWCEAHHITYWSHGGTTGTENGTLLRSHHHHVIHKEQWRIDMTTGVPGSPHHHTSTHAKNHNATDTSDAEQRP